MAGYLSESIKNSIDGQVDLVLRETSIVTPPVNYNIISSSQGLNYNLFTEQDPYYDDFAKQIGKKEAEKLRGVLLVEDKHIFLKNESYSKRLNFGFGHELAHWHLEWHRQLLYYCSEFDLSLKARKQLEREANYFASRLGFMNGLFNQHVADSDLSIRNIKYLSDTYDMSVESCLRCAVDNEARSCALIVMDWSKNDKGYEFKVNYILYSRTFKEECGLISRTQSFGPEHEMTKIMNTFLGMMTGEYTFETTLGDSNSSSKSKEIIIEVWRNNYKAFALVKPK
jgi:hypothetical protein